MVSFLQLKQCGRTIHTCGLDAIPWAGPPVKLAGAVRSPRNISVDVEVCTKDYYRTVRLLLTVCQNIDLTPTVVKNSSEKYSLASKWYCFIEELLLRFAFANDGRWLVGAALDALDKIDFPVVSAYKHVRQYVKHPPKRIWSILPNTFAFATLLILPPAHRSLRKRQYRVRRALVLVLAQTFF